MSAVNTISDTRFLSEPPPSRNHFTTARFARCVLPRPIFRGLRDSWLSVATVADTVAGARLARFALAGRAKP